MSGAFLADAAADPRFPPWWRFVGVGGVVALAIVLIHFGFLLLTVLFIGVFLGFLAAYRQSAYPTSEDVRKKLAVRGPLPGTTLPVLISVGLVFTAMKLSEGSWVSLPVWATIVIATVTGVADGLLLHRAELMRIAGLLDLEEELVPESRMDDAACRWR